MKCKIINVSDEKWEEYRVKVNSDDKFKEALNPINKEKVIEVSQNKWEEYRAKVKAEEDLKNFLDIFNIKNDKKVDILDLIESMGTPMYYDALKNSYFGYIEKSNDGINFIVNDKYADDFVMETKITAYLTGILYYFKKIFDMKSLKEIDKLLPEERALINLLKFHFIGYEKNKKMKNIYFSFTKNNLKKIKEFCPEVHFFAKELYALDINVAYENKEF